jgi:hypothetical protein
LRKTNIIIVRDIKLNVRTLETKGVIYVGKSLDEKFVPLYMSKDLLGEVESRRIRIR